MRRVAGDTPMTDHGSDGLRTLLVGIDAASPAILDRLGGAGSIPTIERVIDDGVVGSLQSQLPPWTASAWPSLYTGANPGKHGVFDFLSFDGYDWDVVNRTLVREHAIWELLDRHGLRSVVVNVPVTHPPRPFDGALIPGYVAPESPTGHPEGVLEDVRSETGDYLVYNPAPRHAPPDERVEGFVSLTRMRGRAFRYLVDRFDPDFGFVQFQQTDTVFHEFPEADWAVRSVYEAVDRELGDIIDQCQPDTVVIASDHGIAEYGGYEIRVNEALDAEGFVETTTGGEGMPSWSAIARNKLQREEAAQSPPLVPRLLSGGVSLAASVGLTSQRIEWVLDRLGLASVAAAVVPTEVIRAGTEQVDFEASTAYMRSRVEMGVRINLAGREPAGVVDPEEYEDVREALIESLRSVRTPDGDPAFESVRRREAVFDGPYVESVADVVVVPAGYEHRLSTSMLGQTFERLDGVWEHVPEGIVAAAGIGVDDRASLDGAHLFDIAPTVLATFGVPASDRMDGRCLPIVEPAGTTAYPPFEPDPTAATDDVTVERRLADLGYIE